MADTARSEKIITPRARLSFPNLLQPRSYNGGALKYSCTLIFPAGTDITVLQNAAGNVALEQWPKGLPPNLRNPFRDAREKEGIDGYNAGDIFISCSSLNPPGIVGPDARTPLTTRKDIYPGCWVVASVVAFAYDTKGNKGVSFGLNNIQKVADDTPLGSFSRPEDDFEAVEDTSQVEAEEAKLAGASPTAVFKA